MQLQSGGQRRPALADLRADASVSPFVGHVLRDARRQLTVRRSQRMALSTIRAYRGRDPADRRGVVVQAARGRGAEVLRLYLVDSGMNAAMDQICAGYEDNDLQLLGGFLRRTADPARTAAEKLTAS